MLSRRLFLGATVSIFLIVPLENTQHSFSSNSNLTHRFVWSGFLMSSSVRCQPGLTSPCVCHWWCKSASNVVLLAFYSAFQDFRQVLGAFGGVTRDCWPWFLHLALSNMMFATKGKGQDERPAHLHAETPFGPTEVCCCEGRVWEDRGSGHCSAEQFTLVLCLLNGAETCGDFLINRTKIQSWPVTYSSSKIHKIQVSVQRNKRSTKPNKLKRCKL